MDPGRIERFVGLCTRAVSRFPKEDFRAKFVSIRFFPSYVASSRYLRCPDHPCWRQLISSPLNSVPHIRPYHRHLDLAKQIETSQMDECIREYPAEVVTSRDQSQDQFRSTYPVSALFLLLAHRNQNRYLVFHLQAVNDLIRLFGSRYQPKDQGRGLALISLK